MNSRIAGRSVSLGLLAGLMVGCGYGPISPTAYEHAKSLYTAANLQRESSVEAAETAIAADAVEGTISTREAEWLLAICADCRAADWDAAQAAARRMMEDQATR